MPTNHAVIRLERELYALRRRRRDLLVEIARLAAKKREQEQYLWAVDQDILETDAVVKKLMTAE